MRAVFVLAILAAGLGVLGAETHTKRMRKPKLIYGARPVGKEPDVEHLPGGGLRYTWRHWKKWLWELPPSPTSSNTRTPSRTASNTPSQTGTPSTTLSASNTPTPSTTRSISGTPSTTRSVSPTPSTTKSASKTGTRTPSTTSTRSASSTPSQTPSSTRSGSNTPSGTPTPSTTKTLSATPSSTPTGTQSGTPSMTPTSSPLPPHPYVTGSANAAGMWTFGQVGANFYYRLPVNLPTEWRSYGVPGMGSYEVTDATKNEVFGRWTVTPSFCRPYNIVFRTDYNVPGAWGYASGISCSAATNSITVTLRYPGYSPVTLLLTAGNVALVP